MRIEIVVGYEIFWYWVLFYLRGMRLKGDYFDYVESI